MQVAVQWKGIPTKKNEKDGEGEKVEEETEKVEEKERKKEA